MCGITGFIDTSGSIAFDEMEAITKQMTDVMWHRGPNDGGVWVDSETGIALGHRRLAIVDLSPEGHQPMLSHNARYVISFNGEIYNFLELRKQLEQLNYQFRSCCDTEVMLAAFRHWGIEQAIKHFQGMFAFALWDREERVLHLGRDRLGEKPLYYGWCGDTFLFGSELKALKAYPGWEGKINREALALFLRYAYVPTPYSIYQDIYKLPPGTILSLRDRSLPKPIPYWSIYEVAQQGLNSPFSGSETEAIEQLDELLSQAIKGQMVADVPLGAFLSGGIDSSTVVALMQRHSLQKVKTFTIGFSEDDYNEAQTAKAVANHLGTDHTELYVTSNEAIAVIPKLPTLYDEPFADSSQIPTFLVSQLARQHVTVSLSGDGGDELFAGYNRHVWGQRLWRQFGWIPANLRYLGAQSLTSLAPLADLLPKTPIPLLQTKLHKLGSVLAVDSPEALYLKLVSQWQDPAAVLLDVSEPPNLLNHLQNTDLTGQMMVWDAIAYLPDDILTKVDRATMGVSLEARVPFLDHRVVEFAWKIPISMKIRDKQGKWLLRQVLNRYVPSQLVERPKMGFGIPLDSWLRGTLRNWAEDLLSEDRLRREGFFQPELIRQKWQSYLDGDANLQYPLWTVLMFQAWNNL